MVTGGDWGGTGTNGFAFTAKDVALDSTRQEDKVGVWKRGTTGNGRF